LPIVAFEIKAKEMYLLLFSQSVIG